MEHRPRRLFRVLLLFFLAGIFFELMAIHSVLRDSPQNSGNVAVVEIRGVLDDPRPTVEQLQKHLESEEIKAIVLRIDSPGGAVGTSQEIYEAVLEAAKKKKIVVSMGDVAASGGYYVASAAHRIFALPGTITGSIGVIAHFPMVGDLLRKANLRWEVVKAGEMKDIGSPFKPMTPEERKLLHAMTEDMHDQFIADVAAGRKLPVEKVRALADGRMFSGRQAKKESLIDELGGLEKAIDAAAKLAGISGEPKVRYPKRERFGWFKRMADGKFDAPLLQVEYRMAP